jgi:hypothetical protein
MWAVAPKEKKIHLINELSNKNYKLTSVFSSYFSIDLHIRQLLDFADHVGHAV